MTRNADKPLSEIDLDTVAGCVVLVDVDGTIVADRDDTPSALTREALKKLQLHNDVFLFSNNSSHERLLYFVHLLNIPPVLSSHRKPDPRLMRDIPHAGKPLVVIGDKVLTDGLFALFVSMRFIRVKRLRGPRESLYTRLSYWLDDISSPLLNAINRRT